MTDAMVACRIYVVEHAPNSQRAIKNLTAFCRAHLPERHRIEIVDVFAHPERALADKILLTPTLVIDMPSPARRVVGDLSDSTILQETFALEARPELRPEARGDPGRRDA